MFQLLLFGIVICIGIYFTNKSIVHSFCYLLLSYFILSYNIGFQINLFGTNSVVSFSRVYLIAFLLVYLYKRINSKNKIRFIESNNDLFLFLFLFYIVFSMFWGVSFSYDLKSFFSERWLLGFGAFFIAKDVFRTKETIFTLFKYLFLSSIILTIYGLIEFITSTPLMQLPFFNSLILLDPSFESLAYNPNKEFVTRGSMLRLSGTFWNSIIFSIALTFLYPYYLILRRYNIKFLKMGFIPVTLVAILTIGRTAWFSMMLALFFNLKRYKILTILAICTFYIIAIPYFNQNIEDQNYLDQNIFSINSRTYTLPILLIVPIKSLIFGSGIGSYFYAIENDNLTIFTRLCGDNSLLQIIYIIGFIGAFFILVFFISYYNNLKKIRIFFKEDSFESSLLKGTQVMIIIQLVIFVITNSIFQDTRLIFIFFSLLGAIRGYFNSQINEHKRKTQIL